LADSAGVVSAVELLPSLGEYARAVWGSETLRYEERAENGRKKRLEGLEEPQKYWVRFDGGGYGAGTSGPEERGIDSANDRKEDG